GPAEGPRQRRRVTDGARLDEGGPRAREPFPVLPRGAQRLHLVEPAVERLEPSSRGGIGWRRNRRRQGRRVGAARERLEAGGGSGRLAHQVLVGMGEEIEQRRQLASAPVETGGAQV